MVCSRAFAVKRILPATPRRRDFVSVPFIGRAVLGIIYSSFDPPGKPLEDGSRQIFMIVE
jgi:hypothetical protein